MNPSSPDPSAEEEREVGATAVHRAGLRYRLDVWVDVDDIVVLEDEFVASAAFCFSCVRCCLLVYYSLNVGKSEVRM